MDFTGPSLALSVNGLADVATRLCVGAAEVSAIVSVETHGAGFLSDRRPKILFERHIFSRLTEGQYDSSSPEVSSPTQGGYGDGGAHQYDRLAEAVGLNRDAALQSASWGIGQIMGENYAVAGFTDVETMVSAMTVSEDAQLAALGNFIAGNGLAKPLAVHDWASFARGYNGPDYATNRYDIQLNGYYQKYVVGATPDLEIRAAQMYLVFRGFDPHGIDGIAGPATGSALIAFQNSIGTSPTGVLDDATMQALLPQ